MSVANSASFSSKIAVFQKIFFQKLIEIYKDRVGGDRKILGHWIFTVITEVFYQRYCPESIHTVASGFWFASARNKGVSGMHKYAFVEMLQWTYSKSRRGVDAIRSGVGYSSPVTSALMPKRRLFVKFAADQSLLPLASDRVLLSFNIYWTIPRIAFTSKNNRITWKFATNTIHLKIDSKFSEKSL